MQLRHEHNQLSKLASVRRWHVLHSALGTDEATAELNDAQALLGSLQCHLAVWLLKAPYAPVPSTSSLDLRTRTPATLPLTSVLRPLFPCLLPPGPSFPGSSRATPWACCTTPAAARCAAWRRGTS